MFQLKLMSGLFRFNSILFTNTCTKLFKVGLTESQNRIVTKMTCTISFITAAMFTFFRADLQFVV